MIRPSLLTKNPCLKMASENKMNFIKLNLKGIIFETKPSLFRSLSSGSPLSDLSIKSKFYDAKRKQFIFNRNAAVFDAILDYLTYGNLHVPKDICPGIIRKDLEFWKIPESKVEKCCWKHLYQTDEDIAIINNLLGELDCPEPSPSERDLSFKDRTWNTLNNYKFSYGAKLLYGVLWLCVVLSTMVSAFYNIPELRQNRQETVPLSYNFSRTLRLFLETEPHPSVLYTDTAVNIILSLDWILRLLFAPNKKLFMKSILNLTEMTACISTWALFTVETIDNRTEAFYSMINILSPVFGFFIITRVFRVLRLIKHIDEVRVITLSIKSSLREFFILIVTFSCVALMFGLLLYIAELSSITSIEFSNGPIAIWWAIVTMTTVGYGDYYPTTPQGYFIGCICAITGILLVALPVAVTTSNFSEINGFSKLRKRFMAAKSNDTFKNKL